MKSNPVNETIERFNTIRTSISEQKSKIKLAQLINRVVLVFPETVEIEGYAIVLNNKFVILSKHVKTLKSQLNLAKTEDLVNWFKTQKINISSFQSYSLVWISTSGFTLAFLRTDWELRHSSNLGVNVSDVTSFLRDLYEFPLYTDITALMVVIKPSKLCKLCGFSRQGALMYYLRTLLDLMRASDSRYESFFKLLDNNRIEVNSKLMDNYMNTLGLVLNSTDTGQLLSFDLVETELQPYVVNRVERISAVKIDIDSKAVTHLKRGKYTHIFGDDVKDRRAWITESIIQTIDHISKYSDSALKTLRYKDSISVAVQLSNNKDYYAVGSYYPTTKYSVRTILSKSIVELNSLVVSRLYD